MNHYVKSVQEGLVESTRFFSRRNKQGRELWVLREFLSYLPIQIVNSDIASSAEEPNDVAYGPYGFQVKEVLSEGRRRGKEYTDKLTAITDETKPVDLLESYTHVRIPLNDALPRVAAELARHRIDKYKEHATEINVLVYLNLCDTTYTKEAVTLNQDEFLKWKSVSLVSNNCAIILTCTDATNSLLEPLVGKLYIRN